MTMRRLLLAALLAAPLGLTPLYSPAYAETQGVVVVVNDVPITELDITQRISLMKILGDAQNGLTRKQALKSLIDEQVKIAEAAKFKLMPSDGEIKDYMARVSKGMETTPEGLLGRLKKQGISETTFRRYISALIGFNRIISSKYRDGVKVQPADVDAKFAEINSSTKAQISKIMNDPRMQPVTVYSLMEITLPVEAQDVMLLQARAVEAAQFLRRFKGCGNARAAAEGIFNVKIGKKFDADAAKLPKPMKAALDKVGSGRAVGPIRAKQGIQIIAFCGSRKIVPPKPEFKMPTREQVERSLINQKYDALEEDYLKTVRGNVYVEYRNSSYAQD
jgi:peptidyl-prolyl cis-trans isomerase SurA